MFFFFQAEDGIRDDLVTGVQTCALPIYTRFQFRTRVMLLQRQYAKPVTTAVPRRPSDESNLLWERFESLVGEFFDLPHLLRSEERRVGKECRYRWSRLY